MTSERAHHVEARPRRQSSSARTTGYAVAEVQQLYVRWLRLSETSSLPAERAETSVEAPQGQWFGSGPVVRRTLKNVGKLVGATGFEPVTSTV